MARVVECVRSCHLKDADVLFFSKCRTSAQNNESRKVFLSIEATADLLTDWLLVIGCHFPPSPLIFSIGAKFSSA